MFYCKLIIFNDELKNSFINPIVSNELPIKGFSSNESTLTLAYTWMQKIYKENDQAREKAWALCGFVAYVSQSIKENNPEAKIDSIERFSLALAEIKKDTNLYNNLYKSINRNITTCLTNVLFAGLAATSFGLDAKVMMVYSPAKDVELFGLNLWRFHYVLSVQYGVTQKIIDLENLYNPEDKQNSWYTLEQNIPIRELGSDIIQNKLEIDRYNKLDINETVQNSLIDLAIDLRDDNIMALNSKASVYIAKIKFTREYMKYSNLSSEEKINKWIEIKQDVAIIKDCNIKILAIINTLKDKDVIINGNFFKNILNYTGKLDDLVRAVNDEIIKETQRQ